MIYVLNKRAIPNKTCSDRNFGVCGLLCFNTGKSFEFQKYFLRRCAHEIGEQVFLTRHTLRL